MSHLNPTGRLNASIAEHQRLQREAAERIAARDGSRVGYWPEDDQPGYVSPAFTSREYAYRRYLGEFKRTARVPGPAAALAQVADDYGMHEQGRNWDSTAPEDALLVNLPHDYELQLPDYVSPAFLLTQLKLCLALIEAESLDELHGDLAECVRDTIERAEARKVSN